MDLRGSTGCGQQRADTADASQVLMSSGWLGHMDPNDADRATNGFMSESQLQSPKPRFAEACDFHASGRQVREWVLQMLAWHTLHESQSTGPQFLLLPASTAD